MPAKSSQNQKVTHAPIGLIGVWRRLLADGLAEREVIRTLFRRNFIHQFAGSGLGFAWVIIMPCLPVFIYNVLQVMGVFATPGTGIPRSIFLTFGLILYYTFSETVNGITADSVRNSRYIVESGIPKMAIILSTTVEVVANLVIRTVVFLILTSITYGMPPWSFALLPVFAIPLIVLGLTLGLVLNLFCVLYHDLLNIVRTVSFYLLFASGVFTTIPDEGTFFHLLRMSPIYQLISIGRNMALETDFTLWPHALLAAFFCLVALPFALVAFYRAEKLVNSYL